MVLLLAHSHFSLLMAPCSPKVLCEEAVRLGHDHLVLTDRNGLYGFMPFAEQARRVGLQAIYGVDLVQPGQGRLFALARDQQGYRSLCRLVTALMLEEGEEKEGAEAAAEGGGGGGGEAEEGKDFDLVTAAGQYQAGLCFLCEDPELLPRLREALDPERLFLPLRAGDKRQKPFAKDLPRVAVHEVWFARPEDHEAHLLFLAVKDNHGLDLHQSPEARPSDMHLPTRQQLEELRSEHPEATARAEAICKACTLDFAAEVEPVFPTVAVPEGSTAKAQLCQLAKLGLRQRYSEFSSELQQRLDKELRIIGEMGFAPYFLVVYEIVQLARERGIAVVGRGSAADSLVSFALGFTDADPMRYGLLFERFLNPARQSLPDIDLDFCWRRRDELLEAVYEHFGHERVAMIATYNHFGPRGAYREAAKALGLPPAEVDRRSKLLPYHFDREGGERGENGEEGGMGGRARDFGDLVAGIPRFYQHADLVDDERERRILRAADQLLLAPRYLGVHPGGIVLTPGAIVDYTPLERASKGLVVTQYDMHFVEALGLVKIDLLGNRALTILQDSLELVEQQGRQPPELLSIAEDDKKTARLLCEGRTLGCFQVESPAMRTLLRQMQAENMEQVIQAVALIRPGPSASGMKELFVRRKRGLLPIEVHPVLEPIFRETQGLMLYQEDVIRAAMAVAGLDPAEGDRLRRHLGKVRGGEESVRDAFRIAGLRQGQRPQVIEEVWQEMSRFAAYSFCKAHAVTYGRIAYRCVFMKAHHPEAFMAAMLSNDAGYYEKGVYVEEAKRLGVAMRGPCVHRSGEHFAVEEGGGRVGQGKRCRRRRHRTWDIRVGLMEVRNLGQKSIKAILEARRLGGAFRSLTDFLRRSAVSRDEAENLILCGALDCLEHSRPELLWRLQVWAKSKPQEGEASQAGFSGWREPKPMQFPSLPEYPKERLVELQLQILGYSLGVHPVDVLWGTHGGLDVVPLGEVPEMANRFVVVLGWVVALRRLRSKAGKPMLFFTLEDGTGVVEACLFPDLYRRFATVLRGRGPYLVQGKVESQLGGVSLRVGKLSRWRGS